MQTKTLQQTVTFKASPREVYDMLMDSKKHRSLSGEPAKISKKVGGKFTAWGSHLSGINLVLKPGKKIVQAWRATGWWPDHYSIATFDITKVRGGSKLKFTQLASQVRLQGIELRGAASGCRNNRATSPSARACPAFANETKRGCSRVFLKRWKQNADLGLLPCHSGSYTELYGIRRES
jgi:uncharacterized protein YndB with AHSA1/START domain